MSDVRPPDVSSDYPLDWIEPNSLECRFNHLESAVATLDALETVFSLEGEGALGVEPVTLLKTAQVHLAAFAKEAKARIRELEREVQQLKKSH